LALGVFALALWAQHGAMIGVFFDDGIYVSLAKALGEGHGYRSVHLPGAPPAVHFPPLYPLALSFLGRLWPSFPDNVALFQLFDSAALAGAAWVIAAHARRIGVPSIAQYVALPLGFSAFPLLTIVGVRFSEPLFLLLTAGAIAIADGRPGGGLARGLAAGVLGGLAALTRAAGIAVIIGVIAAFVLRRERTAATGALLVSLVLLVPWVVWTVVQGDAVDPMLVANYGTYAADVGQSGVWTLVGQANPFRPFDPLARLTLPPMPVLLWYLLAVVLSAAVVWGGITAFPRAKAWVITLGGYAVIVAAWPFAPDRFVWIILPWVAVLLATGLSRAWSRSVLLRPVVAVLLVAMVTGYSRREAVSLGTRGFAETAMGISSSFGVLVPAVRAELPESAVVASADEALMYLYTGRKAVPSYLFRWQGRTRQAYNVPDISDFFCDAGVTHVAVTGAGDDATAVVSTLRDGPYPTVTALFELSGGGPALYRFRCPS
jgi:hypothetical protein